MLQLAQTSMKWLVIAMHERRARTFLTTTVLYWFAMYTYPMLLTDHAVGALGATPATAGLIVGSYGLTQMLLRIPLGMLSDRLRRRKPFLIFGVSMAALAGFLLFLAKGPVAALIGRGAAGVGASAWVAFTVLYASYFPAESRAKAMGSLSAVMYGAQLTGTLLGGLLAKAQGTRASFLLATAVGVVGIIEACRLSEMKPQTQPPSLKTILQAVREPLLLMTAGISILLQLIMWGTLYGFSPKWAMDVLGADAAQQALLSTVHLLPNIACSYACGAWITPRLGERMACIIGFGLMTLSMALMPLTQAFGQMLALQAVCGAGVGFAAPMLLSLCTSRTPPSQQGVAMGAYQSIYGLGMFLGPLVAGQIVQWFAGNQGLVAGYRAVFAFAAIVGAIAMIFSVFLPKRGKA